MVFKINLELVDLHNTFIVLGIPSRSSLLFSPVAPQASSQLCVVLFPLANFFIRFLSQVTKMVKTVTTRTVRQVPLGPDGLPIADGSSPLGSYTDSIDRRFMKNGERFVTPQATSTLTRSYNHSNYGDSYYSPHDAYGDVCDNYGSLSRGLNYRPYRPYGYRMENSYTLPIRRDDYGHMAQPQVPVGGSSTMDLNRSQPERFQPEPYGLEDDRRSLGPDDEEPYELEPDYSTANRRTLPSAARAMRDPLRNGPRVR